LSHSKPTPHLLSFVLRVKLRALNLVWVASRLFVLLSACSSQLLCGSPI
jgi:hypothetical protein